MSSYYPQQEIAMRMTQHGRRLAYPPHFHASLEIVHVRAGHSTVLVGQTEYRLGSDDLLIVFPHQVHGYRDDEDLDRRLLFIPLDYIPAFRETVSSRLPDCPIVHDAARFPRLLSLFDDIHFARYGDIPHSEAILGAYLTAFVGLLLPALTLSPVGAQPISTVHTILRYCALHYREPLTISQLAEDLHLHRNVVSAVFSAQLHTGFNDYLNSLRIEDACLLLRTTSATVTEISAAVGFETIRTFNRAFLRIRGMTPSEYRERRTTEKR